MDIQEKFSGLVKKREELQQRANIINLRIEEAKKKSTSLLDMAREKYGVNNVEELRAKVAQMRKENEEAISTFQKELETAEVDITMAEKVIANVATM